MNKIYKSIDRFTFGKSPAAQYLAHLLNIEKNPYLNKKISSLLIDNNKTILEMQNAFDNKTISLNTFQKFLFLQRNNINFNCENEKIQNLVKNLLIAKLKPNLRKSQKLQNIESVQKKLKQKITTKDLDIKCNNLNVFNLDKTPVKYNLKDIKDNISDESLNHKWEKKMIKKNIKI